jgi:hypothetical protein
MGYFRLRIIEVNLRIVCRFSENYERKSLLLYKRGDQDPAAVACPQAFVCKIFRP